jgi:transposase
MSKTFRPWDVEQIWLLPPSVQDLVPAGHIAHFVRDLVRTGIDLSAVMASYDNDRGYPPYHPGMMTALLLYAYSQGVYSSRRIARACEERLDFAAVTGLQYPDFRTISDFRKRHLKALSGLFKQILELCRAAGLVQLGHVALDGTKIKANASKHKAMSYGRMQEAEAKLAKEIEDWMQQAEAADAAEDRTQGSDRRGDETPEWVANKQKRLDKIRAAKAALEAEAKEKAEAAAASRQYANEKSDETAEEKVEDKAAAKPAKSRRKQSPEKPSSGVPDDKAQRNFTDPESRIMKTKDGFVQGYNAQAAVDAKAQVIVGHDLSQCGNDKRQLEPMLDAIEAANGCDPTQLSVDAGYCSEENLEKLDARGIDAYVATGRQKHGAADAGGATPAKAGTKTLAMQQKLRDGGFEGPYRLRKQTVEPVFGQIKEARGFRQFLLRGLETVKEEWGLVCTVHNILKLAATRPGRLRRTAMA